jgi:hypothetical protein
MSNASRAWSYRKSHSRRYQDVKAKRRVATLGILQPIQNTLTARVLRCEDCDSPRGVTLDPNVVSTYQRVICRACA